MTRFKKPPPWNIRPDLVDSRYRDLWRGLCVLIPFWKWPDTRIIDVASRTYASSVNGAPIWQEGPHGPEMYFDGSDDALVWNDAAYLRRPSTAITIYMLYVNESEQEAWADIFCKAYGTGSTTPSWSIDFGSFDHPCGRLRISGSYYTSGTVSVPAATRAHLWVRWTSGDDIYIHAYNMDGSSLASNSAGPRSGSLDYSSEPLRVAEGESGANSEQTTTLAAVWDRYLSDAELTRFMRDPFGIIRPQQPHRALTLVPAAPAGDAMPMAMDLYRFRRS